MKGAGSQLKDKVINETEKINSSNEAKEYLQQVRRAKIHIDSLQEEIETMKELAVSIGSMNQSEKVMSSVSQDRIVKLFQEEKYGKNYFRG